MDNNTYKTIAEEKIASFDHACTSDHIRMLKIMHSYIPEHFRRHLIIYIKYLELQQVFSDTPNIPESAEIFETSDTFESTEKSPVSSLIRQLLPFCSLQEKQQFQNIENMINSFEQLKNMMEMFEMMKDMFGDGEGGFNPEMLAGMMNGMDGFDFSDMFKT